MDAVGFQIAPGKLTQSQPITYANIGTLIRKKEDTNSFHTASK